MSLEDSTRLARLYFESSLAPDDSYLEDVLAPDFNVHAIHGRYGTVITPGGDDLRGPAMVRQFNTEWRTLWRDASVTLDEVVAERDRVIVQWTFSGVQVGTYLGIPATNRRITFAGFNIFRIACGRLAEAWDMFDRVSLFQQLGVLPPTRDILQGRAMPAAVASEGG